MTGEAGASSASCVNVSGAGSEPWFDLTVVGSQFDGDEGARARVVVAADSTARSGSVLSEGPAILQYLADRHPESKLAPPASTFQRYRLQEWLNFVATELHRPWAALFYPATTDEQKAAIRKKLSARIEFVAERLRRTTYLMGSDFTVADAYAFSVLRWAYYSGVSLPTIVGTYMLHVGARPAVTDALHAERLKR